ncbi:MAG: hypothetical protein Q8M76_16275, partial [Spirochaetaceae bacterium]|nr:hypothetical protein [Spirochaetaceae bacterium]
TVIDRIAAIAAGSLSAAAPLLPAALGGLLTARAGSLTVALEGSMLAGAFAAAAVANAAAPAVAAAAAPAVAAMALVAAALAGMILALLVGATAELLGADVFVAGLAANLLAPGAASMISQALYGTKGVLTAEALRASPIWPGGLAEIPLLGRALFGQGWILYLLAFVAVVLVFILDKSVFGLRIKAAGEDPEISRAAGIDPRLYRIGAHLIAGGAAGLSGAYLASQVAAFVPGISAGRGWIALVAVYLGGRRAGGVALACLGFGFLIAASNALQGGSSARSGAALLAALPYVATAIALIAWRRAARRARGSRGD